LDFSTFTDLDLIKHIQENKGNSSKTNILYQELFSRHNGRLTSNAIRLCQNDDAADDIVQDTWIKFYKSSDQIRDNLTGWLNRALKSVFIDTYRHEIGRKYRKMERLKLVNESEYDNEENRDQDFLAILHNYSNVSSSAQSAEQEYIIEQEDTRYQTAVNYLLGKKDGSFFLAYPGLKAKTSTDKTRFFRVKPKLMKSMYELCVRHDIFKDTQMTARQENMFRDKYLFGISQPDLIKKYAISSKEDFNSLDQDACEKLIRVCLTLF